MARPRRQSIVAPWRSTTRRSRGPWTACPSISVVLQPRLCRLPRSQVPGGLVHPRPVRHSPRLHGRWRRVPVRGRPDGLLQAWPPRRLRLLGRGVLRRLRDGVEHPGRGGRITRASLTPCASHAALSPLALRNSFPLAPFLSGTPPPWPPSSRARKGEREMRNMRTLSRSPRLARRGGGPGGWSSPEAGGRGGGVPPRRGAGGVEFLRGGGPGGVEFLPRRGAGGVEFFRGGVRHRRRAPPRNAATLTRRLLPDPP